MGSSEIRINSRIFLWQQPWLCYLLPRTVVHLLLLFVRLYVVCVLLLGFCVWKCGTAYIGNCNLINSWPWKTGDICLKIIQNFMPSKLCGVPSNFAIIKKYKCIHYIFDKKSQTVNPDSNTTYPYFPNGQANCAILSTLLCSCSRKTL